MTSDIEDTDIGLWQITETSVYLIDLDGRRLKRIPGAAAGTHGADDAVLVGVRDLTGDFGWMPLLELLMCRLGQPLVALEGTADTETTCTGWLQGVCTATRCASCHENERDRGASPASVATHDRVDGVLSSMVCREVWSA
jgi:hypothetical protein